MQFLRDAAGYLNGRLQRFSQATHLLRGQTFAQTLCLSMTQARAIH